MLRLLTDEDFNRRIYDGLLRRNPELDIVRAQDAGLSGAHDPEILAGAGETGRILLTHDERTMSGHVEERILAGQRVPGVFVISQSLPIAYAIDEILTLAECSYEGEWENAIVYLPL